MLTSCESKEWTTPPTDEVEVYEFYDMLSRPGVTFDIYSKDRGGKLPLMIEDTPTGIASYDLLNYTEDMTSGDITFNIVDVDLTTNILRKTASYVIKIDYDYGFAKVIITTSEVGKPEVVRSEYDASLRISKRKN